MRVLPSLPRSGLGLTLLAAFSYGMPAQQAKQDHELDRPVRPTERITIKPTVFQWSELLQLQASLESSGRAWAIDPSEQAPMQTIEPPLLEVPTDARVRPTPPSGGVERIGPCAGSAAEPPLSLSVPAQFDVAGNGGLTMFIPPDAGGGVGPNHLMTTMNNRVQIYTRLGVLSSAVDLLTFWAPVGATLSTTYPRVYFDTLSDRWIATARDGVPATSRILFAISDTDNPALGWTFYSIVADPGALQQADWITVGQDSTWIAISANMFNLAGTSFLGTKTWALDKSTALVPGGPLTVWVFATGYPTGLTGGVAGSSSFMPAQTYDAAAPALYMVSNSFSSGGVNILQTFQITGFPVPSVTGIPGSTIVSATSGMAFVTTTYSSTAAGQKNMQQVGDVRLISTFSTRIASVCVRNSRIWLVHSGGQPGPSSNTATTKQMSAWYQLNAALMPAPVVQSGQIAGALALSAVVYPSIAVNCANDVLIGFAQGDSGIDPASGYSMRLGTDVPGFMGSINLLDAGDSSYWKNFGVGTTAQYGRYSSTAVDPNDDETLWTLQQSAGLRVGGLDDDSRWDTRWGRLGDCETLPEITDDPDSFAGCVGDPVTFMVVATTGSNPLTYQWRHDNAPIPGATTDTYSIGTTVAADAGNYDVVICGCGQKISAAASLSFGEPSITMQPVDAATPPGGPASFMVAGVPSLGILHYQWMHEGNPVGTDSDTYSIAATVGADYGEYHCVVSDDCGPLDSDSVTLGPLTETHNTKLARVFDVFITPESKLACLNGTVTFTAAGYPPTSTFVWRKDEVAIPGETNSTLVIGPLNGSEDGAYDVVATFGSQVEDSNNAPLTVTTRPTITNQPDDVILSSPAPVTFSVEATGTGPLSYQWKYRPPVPFAAFVDILGATDPDLVLENATTANAGSYRCTVSNLCGGTASSIARLIFL